MTNWPFDAVTSHISNGGKNSKMDSFPGLVAGCERSSGRKRTVVAGLRDREYRKISLLPWQILLKICTSGSLRSGETGDGTAVLQAIKDGMPLLIDREEEVLSGGTRGLVAP